MRTSPLLAISLPLLICSLTVCSAQELQLATSSEQSPGYVDFLQDYSRTHDCVCNTSYSEYDFVCEIVKKDSSFSTEDGRLRCFELPLRVVAHLNISCSGCPECVTVNIHEMTRAHFDTKRGITVYPPSEVSVHECRINSLNIRMDQLRAEKVNITEGMEVAQFGVPQTPGVGGYYTMSVRYPPNFNESDCWLSYLHINKTNLWFLPTYVMQKCQHIRSIQIVDSPITWVSMSDLLALRSIDSLTLRNCNVSTFADDAINKALSALDAYLQRDGPQPVVENAQVAEAVKQLHKMRRNSGRLNLITHLYDMMDSANISFSLLFGYRSGSLGGDADATDIPYGTALSYLNLAHNRLTEIPYAISMFGNLAKIDLSHNQISSLYGRWLCWYPPIPDSEKATSNRHCYWFRGSRQTLKVLDLSHNRIDKIGEIQPWHGVALAELHLQNNFIITINSDAFRYSPLAQSLLQLHLDENPLTLIHLDCLNRLEVLSIRNGNLTNLEANSIPKSPRLRVVNVTNNAISAIAPKAFYGLPSLEIIDLRRNRFKYLNAVSFLLSKRPTFSSRVVLLTSGQKVESTCNCNHVYPKILFEEWSWLKSKFEYPVIPDSELKNTSCHFYSLIGGSSQTSKRSLYGTSYSEFLCEFSGGEGQIVPTRYCGGLLQNKYYSPSSNKYESLQLDYKMGNSGNSSALDCFETCVPQCFCYRTAEWSISNINCSSIGSNRVRIVIGIPVKYMYLSGIKTSSYFHRITESTLKWKTKNLSNALQVLFLNGSNVYHIEENAFVNTTSLMLLYLDDNKLKNLSSNGFCNPKSNLRLLSLTRNRLSSLDVNIFSKACLPKLNEVKISENPWACRCDEQWLTLHKSLVKFSRTTQIVSDFSQMYCTIDPLIIEACNKNRDSEQWQKDCKKIFLSNGSQDYPVSDDGKLISVCNRISSSEAEKQQQIILITLGSAMGLALLCLVALAIRRRHRLLAVVRVVVLLKYQRDRRQHKASRNALPYDAMMWASDRDQDCLVDVLNCVRSASSGDQLELCVPESFLYSDLCSCPLTYFDCPAEGAKFSGKVVVALSERFLDTQYLALCQVIRELDSVGRSPFKDIVFLRLSSHKVSLQRNRQVGPEDVEVFKTLQRILAASEIVYKSVDWEYRLIERIRSRDPSAVLPSVSTILAGNFEAGELHGPYASESGELIDFPVREEQSLIVDVDRSLDLMRSRIDATIRDWPPFHSDKVSELFILSASESRDQLASASSSVVESIARRLPAVRLGTNDAALAARWPVIFEAATPADRINSFLMKRTRQFVVLLSNGLLSWLRAESELQREFQAFLAANSFRRRLLVILVEPVDSRSRTRYEALANHRLDGGESGSPTNWFDMSAEDIDEAALGRWLESVLFKRPE